MRSPQRFLKAAFLLLPLLLFSGFRAYGVVFEDYTPEVTARVVRISMLRGDVQIRRAGENQTWERATLNLPIVEGDEITTESDSRVEVQIDKDTYARLDSMSALKFTTLRDEGVAVSVPQGTMSLRVISFDKSRGYFEIDGPSTTVSVERSGMYRIDAGDTRSNQVRIAVTQGGEARVYSQNSGFQLRNGRSATLMLEGNFAGEWETGDASRYADDFDTWVMDREATVAKRLRDSYYDRYYDRDIYGAEDLNEYGEWILTRKYGYVWRPYRSSVASYSNWSPYRYGHWRWVPFYGWTWVNDEPWGWATYHHGRWIWDDGYWHWAPYGNSRWRRSWWRPAMVSIVTWNGSVCWYPLSYYDNYYDYNRYYYRRGGRNTTIINNNTTIINNYPNPNQTPNPNASPTPIVPNATRDERIARSTTPPLQRIPPGAVVSVDEKEFGKRRGGYTTPPLETGKTILSKIPDDGQTPPILPDFKTIEGKVSRDILIEKPRIPMADTVKTGAAERKPGVTLDEDLKKQRIYGNRTPVTTKSDPNDNGGGIIVNPNTEPRNTGAVRREKREDTNTNPPVFNPGPVRTTGGKSDSDRETKRQDPNQSPPIWAPNEQKREERREPQRKPREDNPSPPIWTPPNEQKREERREPQRKPREESPSPPVYVPPQPKPREEPRPQPPSKPRDEPRPQPPPKSDSDQKPTQNQRKNEKGDN